MEVAKKRDLDPRGKNDVTEGEEYLLQRIQKELDWLRDVHRKTLLVKSDMIKVMEKEVSELRQRLEAEKKEEIRNLQEHYNKQLLARKEMYKDILKKKILDYKNLLDNAYRQRVLEYQRRYNEAMNKLKELYRKR